MISLINTPLIFKLKMEENKEQILADFQSCTGIEDVGECLMHLEATGWNLLEAINTVMPEESQTLPSEREVDLPMEVIEDSQILARGDEIHHIGQNSIALDTLSTPVNDMQFASRLLNFCVKYRDNMVPLEVPESETVAAIKSALFEELGVPPCRQELSGWRRNHITDDTLLSSLHLPQSTDLFLFAPDHLNLATNLSTESSSSNDLQNKFQLHIVDTTNNKEYNLHFPESKTVLEIKLDVRDITNIPVRYQKWFGWPETLRDENTKLSALGLPSRTLDLILSKDESHSSKSKKQLVVDVTSSESSDNEFEDAAECFGVDDDMFHATAASKRIQPLMPDDIEDESTAVTNFEKEFTNRYGPCHPPFHGTLSDALLESCFKPAKERRPLAIYLHHDASILTNVFCTQLLCSETVTSYLTLNFVTWAWDLTYESNKTFLLAVISQNLGLPAANSIKNIALDNLPALMVITKVRSMPEVLTVIPGNVGLDDLMTRLVHAVEVFNSEMASEIWEEEEREAREMVKREQDAAYEASLLADRAKEEARRQEVEEKLKQEEKEMQAKEEQEQLRQHEEALKDAICKSLAEQLPPEPAADSSTPISHIRVRLPNGITIARRFAADTPLSLLLMFIASQGYPKEEYKVLASWPRRDLTMLEDSQTLQELKLYPKETVTLEAR